MADLSHWDFAENFSGYDAAALILGLEPRESQDEEWRVRVVSDRMELHYKNSLYWIFHQTFGNPLENVQLEIPRRIGLLSIKLNDLNRRNELFDEETPLSDWLADRQLIKFENQEFERDSIANWLIAIGMKSIYQFDRTQSPKHEAVIETDIDPADYPDELSAANIAFRAVTKGHGDPAATFKNRLINYLGSNFPGLNSEAVQRIATVANPDKGRGRKKSNAE